MSAHGPAKRPCNSCPYRRDVPSGVWAASEYDKLPAYDAETAYQPPTAFYCHQQNGRLCAGWCGTHDMQESLSLRVAVSLGALEPDDLQAAIEYESPIELFASGAEAAEHGKAEIESPSEAARRKVARLAYKKGRQFG